MRYHFVNFSFHQILVIVFQFGGGAESLTFLSTVFEILILDLIVSTFWKTIPCHWRFKIGKYQFSFFKTSTAAE